MDATSKVQCFLLPINSTAPEYFWCPSLYEYGVLKEYIDTIYHAASTQEIETTTANFVEILPEPMIVENKCPYIMDPLQIISLIGIVFLILMTFEIIYLIQYHMSRVKTKQQQNQSVQYEEITIKDSNIERATIKKTQSQTLNI